MRVILFQNQFAELVRSGVKRQTIRCKARCKPGDVLSLRRWSGLPYRSKQEVLLESVCTEVLPVEVDFECIRIGDASCFGLSADAQAQKDGFCDYTSMRRWFFNTHGLPFAGWVIRW